MAETLISPGVLTRENDQSFITQSPVTVGAAIIGPTVRGPVITPTVVTSYSQFQNIFGTTLTSGSNTYTYFTSIAAYNYFNSGGTSLLVSRVVSGSFSSATSSIANSTAPALTLATLGEGIIMNNSSSVDASGAIASGSLDNVRWEVVNSNTGSGTFDLLIRRGDDNTTNKVILETWVNLSMDPYSTNYIAKRIGDQTQILTSEGTDYYLETLGSYPVKSKYVRVSEVNTPTPNYFDNNGVAKDLYTGSIPVAASGAFSGAIGVVKPGANFYENINSSNTQGLVAVNYTASINLLANADDYRYNVLITPGLYDEDYTSSVTSIITNTQNRGDNLYILDLVPYGATVAGVTTQASTRNTSYAAAYWPWVQVVDPDLLRQVWVPASTVVAGVYAFNDSVAEPWFAPAGINRGGLGQVVRPERKLPQSTRNTLYTEKINPIATFPGRGIAVYGNKTLQQKASAMDRVNVRRLVIELKNYISQVADTLLFEQNTTSTRNSFLARVNPYLESVQSRRGIYAFQVLMDDSNNTADIVDRNELIGQIAIQPTRTAEFVYLDFNITPTGTTFPG